MKNIPGKLPVLTLLIFGCILFAGCEKKTVKIRYQHYVSFQKALDKNGNLIQAGQGEFFALFYILCLDNTMENAVNFTFDPKKFYTSDEEETVLNVLNNDFGLKNPISVPAGQKKTNLGFIIFKMTGGAAGNQMETLRYHTSSGESVLPWRDSWANLAGPQATLQDFAGFPKSYPAGSNLCDDSPIGSPH